jgi:microcystin-dependent protein
MLDPYIGEIALFAGKFAPQGWFLCDGKILSITQYQALFAVIGATYGGNGTSTFALPDLRGRIPISFGQGSGLTNYAVGQMAGTETVNLTTDQMPRHNHIMGASAQTADQAAPTNNILAVEPTGSSAFYRTLPADTTMNPSAIGTAGNNLPFSVVQPCLAVTYIIAYEGIFPSRP